ncbi:MAG: VOC family protein [Acidimicrobiaceae bacterium]|nr:VOC family protein [Acidimicrobiaceae bacterium]MDE0497918.1 VOC family protein [Acidimicrobiaceae bacterium]
MSDVNPIPADRPFVVPYMTIGARTDGSPGGAADAIEWYAAAFGAQETNRQMAPGGNKVMHAELVLGDGLLFLADDFPEWGGEASAPSALNGSTVTLHRYVADCDATIEKAVTMGAEVLMPPEDMFWGDRFGSIRDPFGHEWSIATHMRDVSPEDMEAAAAAMFAEGPDQEQSGG